MAFRENGFSRAYCRDLLKGMRGTFLLREKLPEPITPHTHAGPPSQSMEGGRRDGDWRAGGADGPSPSNSLDNFGVLRGPRMSQTANTDQSGRTVSPGISLENHTRASDAVSSRAAGPFRVQRLKLKRPRRALLRRTSALRILRCLLRRRGDFSRIRSRSWW